MKNFDYLKSKKSSLKFLQKMVKENANLDFIFGAEIEFHLISNSLSSVEIFKILQKNFKNQEVKREDGEFQFEICTKPLFPLQLAKEVFLIKKSLRNLAKKHDLTLSYCKKFQKNEHNSLHLHFNFNQLKQDSEILEQISFQILQNAKRNLKIFSPQKRNLRRFKDFNSRNSPHFLCYGAENNRSCAIRHFTSKFENERMELRLASAEANVAVLMSFVFHCASLIKKTKTKKFEKIFGNAFDSQIAEKLELLF